MNLFLPQVFFVFEPDGNSRIVAKLRDPAPGTPWTDAVYFQPTGLEAINDHGVAAFSMGVQGTGENEAGFGIWVDDGNSKRLVALEGMAVPGVPGAIFSPNPEDPTSPSVGVPSAEHRAPWFADIVTINNSGQVASFLDVLEAQALTLVTTKESGQRMPTIILF